MFNILKSNQDKEMQKIAQEITKQNKKIIIQIKQESYWGRYQDLAITPIQPQEVTYEVAFSIGKGVVKDIHWLQKAITILPASIAMGDKNEGDKMLFLLNNVVGRMMEGMPLFFDKFRNAIPTKEDYENPANIENHRGLNEARQAIGDEGLDGVTAIIDYIGQEIRDNQIQTKVIKIVHKAYERKHGDIK